MDENFDQLRKLLALKRYEQPPPGYFQSFSGKVLARIEAAEAAGCCSWWARLGLDFKPALMCALGIVVCALLSLGVITSVFDHGDQPAVGLAMDATLNSPAAVAPFNSSEAVISSTQPVFASARFDQFGMRIQPVSLHFK
jgi:hypothetical protein